MMSDLGIHVTGEIWGDAIVARGVINRKGFGKTRHIDTNYLWIQDVVATGRFKFHNILRKDNPADLYTKYLDERTNQYHTNNLAYKFRDGRAQEALNLHLMSRSKEEWENGEGFVECGEVGCVLDVMRIVGDKKASQHGRKESTLPQWRESPRCPQQTSVNPFSQQIEYLIAEVRGVNQELATTARRLSWSR